MFRTILLSLVVGCVCVVSLNADPPVKRYMYVRMEPLKKAARNFSAADAEAFDQSVAKAAKAAFERRPFFRVGDASFTQVGEHDLFDAIMELLRPTLKRDETEKINAFLKEITEAKSIQGYQLARRGGAFHVVLNLTVDSKGIWAFSTQYRQFQILDGYEGMTSTRSFDIPRKKL